MSEHEFDSMNFDELDVMIDNFIFELEEFLKPHHPSCVFAVLIFECCKLIMESKVEIKYATDSSYALLAVIQKIKNEENNDSSN